MNIDLNNIDLTSLNTQELREYENKLAQLMEKVREAIQARRKDDLVKAREQIQSIANQFGITVDELVSPKGSKGAGKLRKETAKVQPKYRHPNDANLNWTGRGRKPKWVEEYISQHGSIAGLEIASQA